MAEQEIVAAFDCGDEDLNGFILTDAPLYRKEKLAVTYTVFEKSNHNHIVAFFSLSNDRIAFAPSSHSDSHGDGCLGKMPKAPVLPTTRALWASPEKRLRLGIAQASLALHSPRAFFDLLTQTDK